MRATMLPRGPLWTFWDYKRERWPADKGMRLDHFLLSPVVAERLVDGGVDRRVRGEENASDHAPAWIVLVFMRWKPGLSDREQVAIGRRVTVLMAALGVLAAPLVGLSVTIWHYLQML